MQTYLEVGIKFPPDHPEYHKRFKKLYEFCNGVEGVEKAFGIEFSCGDGKYMTDFWKWSDDQGLYATVSDEELEKYDGEVDLNTPPRFSKTKEVLKKQKMYVFTIKVDKNEQLRYYLNSKEIKHEY